jgi:hypothetical protein
MGDQDYSIIDGSGLCNGGRPQASSDNFSDSPDRAATRCARGTLSARRSGPISTTNCDPTRGTQKSMTHTFNFNEKFSQLIAEMKLDGRYRTFAQLERIAGEFPQAMWHHHDGSSRRVTVWCSNDYLGMGQHPDVMAAMHRTIDRSGAGTGGTRNIAGTNLVHVQLETELADLHGKEAALIFTSGWVSNLAALGTLGRLLPHCAIFSDALNHNSMIEGIRRSGAERFISKAITAWTEMSRQLQQSATLRRNMARSPISTRFTRLAWMARVAAVSPNAMACPIA